MRSGFSTVIAGTLLLLCVSCGLAEVVVYPGPVDIAPSDQYAVQVIQDGRVADSFVYMTRAQWRSNRSKTTSWTTFSFSGPVTVRVTKLQGEFSRIRAAMAASRSSTPAAASC